MPDPPPARSRTSAVATHLYRPQRGDARYTERRRCVTEAAGRLVGAKSGVVVPFRGVDDDAGLLAQLRAGEESAFAELVGRYQPRLLRLAEATVGSRAVAEEVCQDTWLAVVRGVDRFEERSSFKTWLFRVLLNRARTSASREQRAGRVGRAEGEVVERFEADGAWAEPPVPWSEQVEDRL